ncbi:hypothetical protein JOF40_003607 [Aeromicrobium fastidiosum]|nr:hypothetical protein [Aeromicrobium fastidiosum]
MAAKQVDLSERLTDEAIRMLEGIKEGGWSKNDLREVKRLLTSACRAARLQYELTTHLPIVWDHLLASPSVEAHARAR